LAATDLEMAEKGLGFDGHSGTLGIRLRDGTVTLGEDVGCREHLHEAVHHSVARALRWRPNAE
jgi:hypothetical protein